jgi:signal transduction histidine kinase/DNA-binding NarL/FixJ family response regulator
MAEYPGTAEELRGSLRPEQWRIVHRTNLQQAEPLLAGSLADACIIDLELTNAPAIWTLQKLRRLAPTCPILVYAGQTRPDWEEEAYLNGATHVLLKPVRKAVVASLLERSASVAPAPLQPMQSSPAPQHPSSGGSDTSIISRPGPDQEMAVLRNFSGILKHSLDAEGMTREFFLLLRKMLGFNRGAIFLGSASRVAPAEGDTSRLKAVCGSGVPAGVLQHLELSLDSGIGAMLVRLGRILRRCSDEALRVPEIQKEFELLGAQVAVPILDRENVLGVALFDGRITGEPLTNTELEFVFSLLEQLGLALRNIWLHDQLASNHQMLANILRELSNACVLVRSDLKVLHANKQARRYFLTGDRRGAELEFADLPQMLGSKVYQVLKTGVSLSNVRYEPEGAAGTVYNVNVVPFQGQQPGTTASALLLVEDLTQSEQLRKLEQEAADLRLIRRMADRLTAEIGNALVPVSTHQQLLADRWRDQEFRTSLDSALAEAVKRVNRLVNQMRYLAREGMVGHDSFPLGPLIEESFHEACKYQPGKASNLKYEAPDQPVLLTGDRAALKHALTEVMLNALQANPSEPRIGVRLESESNGTSSLRIEIQDNGGGFTADAAEKATAPFYTTRVVGVGLGLTVTRKIVETHRGKVEIPAPHNGQPGIVRISLPTTESSVRRS